MSRQITLTARLQDYIRHVGMREDADLAALREETAKHSRAEMPSAMVVAKAMGRAGKVVALDVSEEFTAIARRHWARAGISDRIDLRLRPAVESLKAMAEAGEGESFDFAFIDADKPSYDAYYEYALMLVRRGGVIAVDNVLWSGSVVDATDQSPNTLAIRALNKKIHEDSRVDSTLLPIGDGLTLALKL